MQDEQLANVPFKEQAKEQLISLSAISGTN